MYLNTFIASGSISKMILYKNNDFWTPSYPVHSTSLKLQNREAQAFAGGGLVVVTDRPSYSNSVHSL